MPIGPARMPFFDHVAELRQRLFYVILFIFAGSLVIYGFAWEPVLRFVMAPVTPVLTQLGVKHLIYQGPFEAFVIRFKVSAIACLIVGSPFIAWQIGAFFLPALKPKERKWFIPIVLAVAFFFILGAAFCYMVVLTPGFTWLATQGGAELQLLPLADKWITGVLLFMVAFGVGFQTPVVVFGLVYTEIVPYAKMRKNWRVAYLVISIVAAIATPDWSWFSMTALGVCMIILYEGAMALSWLLLRKKIKAQALAEIEA
jgi:sec-independent protein translocase protein TatC